MPRRPIKKFGRPKSLRDENSRYFIVTDGVVTENKYFKDLNKISRDTIKTKPKNVDLDKLVDLAIKYRNEEDYDEAYIVCDIDDHLKSQRSKTEFLRALSKAQRNNIPVLLSNESFDVWVLGHKINVPANARDRNVAQALLKKKGMVTGANDKEIRNEYITPDNVRRAILEAERLRRAYGDNVLSSSGPTTDTDKLVKKITLREE